MAEILGAIASGLTIAGLFKVCIEAFDLIQTSRRQDADLRRLTLKFNIEKCRLYVWGEAMGLTRPPLPEQCRPLDNFMFEGLVRDVLRDIVETFQDTQKMKGRYGCREVPAVRRSPPRTHTNNSVASLAAAFSKFNIPESSHDKLKTITLRTRWVIQDRQKFTDLILEAKTLIDGLQEITKSLSTVARQETRLRHNIQQVRDVNTLQLVADVTQENHPDVSDAASVRVEALTMASTQPGDIEAWADGVTNETDDEMLDIESMSVTELKYRLRLAMAGKKPSKFYDVESNDGSDSASSCEAEELFEVERILDENIFNGVKRYLVKWKGYNISESTWEKEEDLRVTRTLMDWRIQKITRRLGSAHPTSPASLGGYLLS